MSCRYIENVERHVLLVFGFPGVEDHLVELQCICTMDEDLDRMEGQLCVWVFCGFRVG